MPDFDASKDLPFPHRVRGVRANRAIPVVPEKEIEVEPKTDDQAALDFEAFHQSFGGSPGVATYPEWLCYEWLVKKQNLQEGVDFIYQSNALGGRAVAGGLVVDFEIFPVRLYWRVQTEFFHMQDIGVIGADRTTKMQLEGLRNGWKVVDVFESALLRDKDWVLEEAYNGRQVLEHFA